MPIGLIKGEQEFSQQTIVLAPGGRLVMYSDGLTDMSNNESEKFGGERLLKAVNRVANLQIDKAIREVLSDVNQWRGKTPASDDVAILACEMT